MPNTSILVAIGENYATDLESQKYPAAFLLHFLNLH